MTIVKNALFMKGWEEKNSVHVINHIQGSISATIKLFSQNRYTHRIILSLTFAIIILLISFPIAEAQQRNFPSQTLERNPTKEFTTQEYVISILGNIEMDDSNYVGRINSGTALLPEKKDKENQDKLLEALKKLPEANNSWFLIEARDVKDEILLEMPVAVADYRRHGDYPEYLYQAPGVFSIYLLIPAKTNSIVLRKRTGDIVDRVYVEEWEPEVKITNYPRSVGSTDKFQVEIELLPSDKTYSYTLWLKNAKDGSNMGIIGDSPVEPKRGKITENIDLNRFPFTTTDDWVIEAVSYTMFHLKTTVSEPISIKLSSENIEVKISGKDKTTRRSGENDFIGWNYMFYNVDVTRGLKQLCEQGRCFELIWTGEGVQFNEKNWEFKPVSTITTQIPTLNCEFRGSGKQSIHLQVKENGKVIGEDTYTYTVSGIGSDPSLCQINDY